MKVNAALFMLVLFTLSIGTGTAFYRAVNDLPVFTDDATR